MDKQIKLIRKAIGKPKNQKNIITISDASPREVYFIAQALFQRANRLAYEVTGSYEIEPSMEGSILVPAHIWQLIDQSLKRILLVKKKLNITSTFTEKLANPSTTPTDVLNSMLKTNQKINNMLYKQFLPSDVFEQITLAITYTQALLERIDSEILIPSSPPFEKNKTPTDVYKILIECIQTLQRISEASGQKMLKIYINENALHQVEPSDVFSLARIIVAEVQYFNTLLSQDQSLFQTYYPGYKTPSDVYQRAGILLKQLQVLKQEVNKKPAWLEKN